MAIQKLPLWVLKNPVQAKLLRHVAEPVDRSEVERPEFQQLIEQMVVTMYKARGIGLAAPQIGRSIRLAVIAPEVDRDLHEPLVLINPVIHQPSSDQETYEEGCLSVPKVFGPVSRSLRLTLSAMDRRGQPF